MGQAKSVGLVRELSDFIRGIIEWSLQAFDLSIFFRDLFLQSYKLMATIESHLSVN